MMIKSHCGFAVFACLVQAEFRAVPALKRTEREVLVLHKLFGARYPFPNGVLSGKYSRGRLKFMVSVIAHIGFYAAIVLGLKAVFEKLTSLF